MKTVLCDIDHTVSDATWRDALISGDWDTYHSEAAYDLPILAMVNILIALADAGHSIIFITARPEKWRQDTLQWLSKHDIPFNELLMRKDTDYRPAPLMKMDLATTRFKDIKSEVLCIFDDRDDVIDIFKKSGVVSFQVANDRPKPTS